MACSIEKDAQLLANRIALLKQEEMKTWKKIDDTKKRTNEILTLKKRNEERIHKVSATGEVLTGCRVTENRGVLRPARDVTHGSDEQLLACKKPTGREA